MRPGTSISRGGDARAATRVLDEVDLKTTIVNGATAEGIGEVYEIAKHRRFLTTGIVSTQARDQHVPLSP